MTEEEKVLATLQDYADAYCSKDADGLMSLFDDGDDISVIGTGADELCSGWEAIRALFERNFGEATATAFEWHWQHVTVTGDCAGVATTLTIHLDTDEGSVQVPVRWTVALARGTGGWRWLHRHASTAASDQVEGAAYPTGVSGGQDR